MMSKPKRTILLIEDNPGDARLMREYLREAWAAEFELEHAAVLRSGLERLAQGNLALVLLDLSLPDSVGFETFTRVQAAAPQVPIIVLSGQDDEALAIQTVHAGAQDYLVKGLSLDSHLLVRAIRYAIERKRAEEELAKERDLLHMLLDNLPDRIYFKDSNSRFVRISRAVAEQFRIGHPDEAIGKADSDFFTPEHAEAALKDEQQVMASGQAILGKIERETLPDERVTWALTSKLPLRDKKGRVVGTFGISRDITELKNFEEALASERNLLRSLIDNLPDYIYVKDTQGRYVLDNIAHRRVLGIVREEEILGRTVADFFSAAIAQPLIEDDHQVIRTGHPLVNREEIVVDRDGKNRWYATTKVPLRSPEGVVIGLVGISRDITERKLAADQLQKANVDLAAKQGELQQALAQLQKSHAELKSAQFQLIQAEKMQSLGQLAAGVAHEIKNPLAILGMGIEYLTTNVASADRNLGVILADMTEACNRAVIILQDMLDFAAPRALELQAHELHPIIEQALALVRHELAGSGIQIAKEYAGELPLLRLDRNKIQQVFLNLFTNAIHAMAGGGTLTVRTSTRELASSEHYCGDTRRFDSRFRAGETVVMAEVLDTGIGIPPDQLDRIFDPFFTTKPAGKGTGLGLTVTKKIIELHAGRMEIRNRTQGGVKATLWFKV